MLLIKAEKWKWMLSEAGKKIDLLCCAIVWSAAPLLPWHLHDTWEEGKGQDYLSHTSESSKNKNELATESSKRTRWLLAFHYASQILILKIGLCYWTGTKDQEKQTLILKAHKSPSLLDMSCLLPSAFLLFTLLEGWFLLENNEDNCTLWRSMPLEKLMDLKPKSASRKVSVGISSCSPGAINKVTHICTEAEIPARTSPKTGKASVGAWKICQSVFCLWLKAKCSAIRTTDRERRELNCVSCHSVVWSSAECTSIACLASRQSSLSHGSLFRNGRKTDNKLKWKLYQRWRGTKPGL